MESFNLKGNQTMKTTFRLIGAVATVAALFASCKKEAFNEEVKPGQVEMTIIAGADDTKTVLGEGGVVTWSSTGETLAVFESSVSGEAAPEVAKKESNAGETADGGKTMTFGVSLAAKTSDTYDYYALYPDRAYVDNPTDFTSVKVLLGSTQYPTATSFGPAADILVSRPVIGLTAQPKSLELQFARVVAIGKMAITNLNSTENVQKVTFTATGKTVTGRSKINMTDASGAEYGYSNQGVDNVVLDYSNKKIAATNGMTAYFTCWPFKLAARDSFSVEVETENYTFTKNITLAEGKSLAFKVGEASEFSVNFDGIKGVAKTSSTQLVPDGEYVVAYDKNMMTVGTTSNKYRGVAALPDAANADGSYSVDATAAWNFVYDSEKETYLINSVSDNTLYLQGFSSASDFSLKTKADATSFTITKNEETGTYRIANTRCIGYNYNNGNPRFAMYQTTATQQYIDLNLYPAKVVKLAQITVQETLDLSADLAEGEFPVSWKNVDMSCVSVDVYQDADCTTKEESWISVEFNTEKTAIAYTVLNNDTGTDRKAYIKVEAISTDGKSEDSKIIIVTQAAAGDTYVKCNGALESGWYVIGVVESNTVHAINNTVGTSWIKYTDVSITNNCLNNPDKSIIWYYDATTGYILNIDNTNYLYWTSGNVGCCGTTKISHTIEESSTKGIYTVKLTNTNTRVLRRNGTSGYRYYTGTTGSQNISFFKKN